jgi:hypothetical protein
MNLFNNDKAEKSVIIGNLLKDISKFDPKAHPEILDNFLDQMLSMYNESYPNETKETFQHNVYSENAFRSTIHLFKAPEDKTKTVGFNAINFIK